MSITATYLSSQLARLVRTCADTGRPHRLTLSNGLILSMRVDSHAVSVVGWRVEGATDRHEAGVIHRDLHVALDLASPPIAARPADGDQCTIEIGKWTIAGFARQAWRIRVPLAVQAPLLQERL